MLEQNPSRDRRPSRTRRTTAVLALFLIALAPAARAATPYFDATSPVNQTFVLTPGETLVITMTARDTDKNEVLTLSTAGKPLGSLTAPQTPLQGGNVVSTTFTFSPTIQDKGVYTVTFVAQDKKGLMALGPIFIHVKTCLGTANAFGSACAGGTSATPAYYVEGCPAGGQTLTMRTVNGPAGGTAFFLVGPNAGSAPLGNGCALLLAPPLFVLVAPVGANGEARVDTPVPAGYSGTSYSQALLRSPSGAYATTNGRTTIVN